MLLAFDLDKTLLTNDYEMPVEIFDAIMEARSRGFLVTVLTGRQLGSAKQFLDQLEIALPHSVNHGTRIRGAKGEELRRVLLEAHEVDGLLASYLDDAEIEFTCVVDDTLYVRDPEHERWNWVHAESRLVDRFQAGLKLAADKIVFQGHARSAEVDRWVALNHPNMLRYLWGDGFLEVVPSGGDKGTALAYIADLLGVPRKDVVAFGDGANDVSMIEWAGHGVAVGPDAHEGVLAAAREHIDSPENGGVAQWLKRNLF